MIALPASVSTLAFLLKPTARSWKPKVVLEIINQITINAKEIDSVTYADNITWNEDISSSTSESNDEAKTNSESTSTSEQSGTTKHTLHREGNQGVNTYAHDMLEFRQLFINIEQQIINDPELVKCFMMIW